MESLSTAWLRMMTVMLLASWLPGCGDESSTPGPSLTGTVQVITYTGTTAGQDEWSVGLTPVEDGLGDGTFSVANAAAGTTYTGLYSQLPSGFLKLLCTDASACVGYGLKITNDVMAFWFTNPSSLPILALVPGSCPTEGAITHNFVRLPTIQDQQMGWSNTSDASGRKSLSVAGPLVNLSLTNITFQPLVKAPGLETGYTCNGGTLSRDSSHIHLADSGVAVRSNGTTGGGYIGLPVPPSSLADLQAVLGDNQSGHGKDFVGIQWNHTVGTVTAMKGRYVTPGSQESYDDNKQTLQCVGNTQGCIFAKALDPDTGETAGKPSAKTFVSEISDASTSPATPYYGLFTIENTQGEGTMAIKDFAGKYVLVEAAKLAGNFGDPHTAILVEQ